MCRGNCGCQKSPGARCNAKCGCKGECEYNYQYTPYQKLFVRLDSTSVEMPRFLLCKIVALHRNRSHVGLVQNVKNNVIPVNAVGGGRGSFQVVFGYAELCMSFEIIKIYSYDEQQTIRKIEIDSKSVNLLHEPVFGDWMARRKRSKLSDNLVQELKAALLGQYFWIGYHGQDNHSFENLPLPP